VDVAEERLDQFGARGEDTVEHRLGRPGSVGDVLHRGGGAMRKECACGSAQVFGLAGFLVDARA
jgi:hypothetical protein